MIIKLLKKIPLLLFFVLTINCGYQPLLTERFQKFSLEDFEFSDNRKLGQSLANEFAQFENTKNILSMKLRSDQKRSISNKDKSGSITEYNIKIYFDVEVLDQDKKLILKSSFSENSNYKASNLHIDTLNREKIIINNLIKLVAEQITNQLNLIYKTK